MYFENGAIKSHADFEPFAKGIADILANALRSNCRVRVVEREQLQRIIAEQGLAGERMDPKTRVKIGHILGAQHMIMGSFIVDLRDQMQITARSVNVETSEHEAGVDQRDAAKNMLDMVSSLARKLNDALKLPPMPTPVFEGPRPAQRNDELLALRLYSRALEEQDRGNKAQAIKLYQAALAKFPAYPPAQQALRRLQTSG
jgi:hypothetical protein